MPQHRSTLSVEERFWTQILKSRKTPTGCILWGGFRGQSGYGMIRSGRRAERQNHKAHRVAYELMVGPIPDDLCVCHRCDVRNCVNPVHFFLGTLGENNNDRTAKGRTARGDSHYRSTLTEEKIGEARRRVAAGETQKDIAAEFGVSRSALCFALSGRNWKHVGD